MAYGYRSRSKSASRSYSRRSSRFGSFAKKFGMVKSSRARTMKSFKPRFATVGFNRDVEKKYFDRAMTGSGSDAQVTGMNTNDVNNGFMYGSSTWTAYDFATPATANAVSNDLLKGLGQGTTTISRIGNKVSARYIKGAITLTAAKLAGPSSGATNGDMNGEALATASNATTVWQYLRTTFRVCIVKDLQVNSADGNVTWNDVFENGPSGVSGEMGGVHAELRIANMGRFRVLSDQLIKTDAMSPQETVRFMVRGSQIGQVRYNGPTGGSLTDKGIYVIWAAYTAGVVATLQAVGSGMVQPGVTMHSRFCFTDD